MNNDTLELRWPKGWDLPILSERFKALGDLYTVVSVEGREVRMERVG